MRKPYKRTKLYFRGTPMNAEEVIEQATKEESRRNELFELFYGD